MLDELRITIARWRLGRLWGERLPEVATRALEKGIESPALCRLAAMQAPPLREAEALLLEAMRELDIPEPDRRTAGVTLARHYASLILSGKVTPYEGARRIWQEVYNELGQPEELRSIAHAASEIEDFQHVRPGSPETYDQLIAECEKRIVAEASELVEGGQG